MSRKTDLLDIINDPQVSEVIKDDARKQLTEIELSEAVANPGVDADINFAITELRKVLQETAGQGSVDKKEVEDIVNKEMSLAGVQIPIDQNMTALIDAQEFFRMGEFAGWVIEC